MLEKIQLALYDKEGYMLHLVDYLCSKKQSLLEPRVFTNGEMLHRQLQEGKVDVLLAGEEVLEEVEPWMGQVPQMVILGEGNQVREGREYDMVFKYQSAAEIIRCILNVVAENDKIQCNPVGVGKKNTELIGVYAPFGEEVTNSARKLSREKSRIGRTLYVDLELFQTLSGLLGDKRERNAHYRGMSEVIYYVKQQKGKLSLKVESIIETFGNIDSILAVEDYRDLYAMTEKDLDRFLNVLVSGMDYETIIFDVGYLSYATIHLLEQCHKIYMPLPKGKLQQERKEVFYHLLQREGRDYIKDRIEWFEEGIEGRYDGRGKDKESI